MATVQEGDFVVLFGNYDNIFLVHAVTKGAILNNRYGSFHHDDLLGLECGAKVEARSKQAHAKVWWAELGSCDNLPLVLLG